MGERHVFSHAFYELPGGGALAFFNFADPEQQARYKAQPQPLFVHLALEVDRARQRDLKDRLENAGHAGLGGRSRVHIFGLRDRPRRAVDRTVRGSAGHRGDPDDASVPRRTRRWPNGWRACAYRTTTFGTPHQARRVSPDAGVAAHRDRGRLPTALLRILHARRRQRRRPIRSAVRSRRTILEAGPGPALRKGNRRCPPCPIRNHDRATSLHESAGRGRERNTCAWPRASARASPPLRLGHH